MDNGAPLPSPPPTQPAPTTSQTERWFKSRQGKIALTIIAALYLLGQFITMVTFIVLSASNWWLPNDVSPAPLPFYLFWIPGFLIQGAIVGVALLLLWKEPKPPLSRY
jgi:hypothetical protein